MFINILNSESRPSLRRLVQMYYPIAAVDSTVKLILSVNRLASELDVADQLTQRFNHNPFLGRLVNMESAFRSMLTERNAFLYTYSGDFQSLLVLARLVYPQLPNSSDHDLWQPWEYTLYYNAPPGYLLFPEVPDSRRTLRRDEDSALREQITAPESFLELITASNTVVENAIAHGTPFSYDLGSYPVNSIISGNFGVLDADKFYPVLGSGVQRGGNGINNGLVPINNGIVAGASSGIGAGLVGSGSTGFSAAEQLCSFTINGVSYIIPTVPEDISESYSGEYESQTPLWWYEDVNMYSGTASRKTSATFHLHQDLWNTNPPHQGMESLISACIAGSYPNGSNTPRGTLKIGSSVRCSGLVACDVTRLGAIDSNGYFMEATLTISITQEAPQKLSADLFLNKQGSGSYI